MDYDILADMLGPFRFGRGVHFLQAHNIIKLRQLFGMLVDHFEEFLKMLGILKHECLSLIHDQHLDAREEIKVKLLRALVAFLAGRNTQIDGTCHDNVAVIERGKQLELRFPGLS